MSKYFSQCGQDQFLNEKVFKGKKSGVFVDIGANDGVTLSNSFFFEKELGWKGVCFETLNEAFDKIQKSRQSININACISDPERKDFFLSVKGYGEMLSGLKSSYDERHLQRLYQTIQEHGGEVKEIEVQCYNINQILKKHSIQEIDFISLDTEGGELEILKSIDFDFFHIKAITVENNYKTPEFRKFLSTKGFEFIKDLDADELYLNKADFGWLKRIGIKRA